MQKHRGLPEFMYGTNIRIAIRRDGEPGGATLAAEALLTVRKVGLIVIFCVAVVFFSLSFNQSANSVELIDLLGKSPNDMKGAIGDVATCTQEQHSIRLPIITSTTVVRRDLYNPVSGNWTPEGDEGMFQYPPITVIACDVKDTAYLIGFSYLERKFRIGVTFSRCKTQAASGICLEIDREERAFDKAIYDGMKYKDAYLDSAEGSFFTAYADLLSDPILEKYVNEMDCGPMAREFVFNQSVLEKCIIEASGENGRFAATTVFEVYDDGYLNDTLIGRFAGRRLFVDVENESAALDKFVTDLQTVVSGKQAEVAKSKSGELDTKKKINDLLGSSSAQ